MSVSRAPAPGRYCLPALTAAFLAALLVLFPAPARAQVPGQNVNMVSGTEWPYGDPFKQRQNEPSVAVSTRNPLHLLAGANDYRTVDIPFADVLPNPKVVGDAWLGVFKSFDGGQTWQSTLLPGYPQDTSPEGLASPAKGYSTAADPTVRAANNGLFHYSGIAFNRGTNQGVMFVAQYLDLANKENGKISQGTDPLRYVRTVVVESGTSGQFLDKPWIAVDVPRGTGTCSFSVPTPAGTVTQTIPAGNVYAVYSVFVGNDNNIRTKIYLRRSTDCGATWGNATKLTEGLPVNQGAVVAVAPSTGHVYVAWRGFSAANTLNTINIVKSTDFGQSFTRPLTIHSLPDFDSQTPFVPTFFDQGTTATSFRTNAFPTLAVDGAGRVHVAWSQRGMVPMNSDARIVMKTSPDGLTWPAQVQIIDPSPVKDDFDVSFTRGHQLMPSLTFTGGKLMCLYYDLRFDQTLGIFTPNEPFVDADGKFYFEERRKIGELLLPNGEVRTFTAFVDDAGLTVRRHTLDVRIAQSDPAPTPLFSTAWVSRYRFGTRGGPADLQLSQLQVNPPNLPMFSKGTLPFFGDFIDVAGLAMRPDGPGGAWQFTTSPERAPVHYAVWTSNQDVRPPLDGNWANYTPPASTGFEPSIFDPTQMRPKCQSGNEGSRDQNIYISRITQGLLVDAPQSVKPLSTRLQRAFAVTLQNTTTTARTFRMTIANQPPGGFASFLPALNPADPDLPVPNPVDLRTEIDVTVGGNAGVARNVFATSSNPTAAITVNVVEYDQPGPSGQPVPDGLTSGVTLNADGTVASLVDPDGKPAGSDILEAEIYNLNVTNLNVTNPNVTTLNVTNLNVTNPNLTNPDVGNLNVTNLNVTNLNVTNPNVINPDIAALNVTNLNVTNPNLVNLNVTNLNVTNLNVTNPSLATEVSDATYTIQNSGNTTNSYAVRLVKTGEVDPDAHLQLLVNKAYAVPVADNCVLFEQYQTTLLVNVPNPAFTEIGDLTQPTATDPSLANATFALAPGETAYVTLRGSLPIPEMTELVTKVVPVAVPQAANTNDPTNTPAIVLPFFVATASVPDGTVGVGYLQTLSAAGGIGALTWSLAGGSLPAGIGLSAAGVLSGTPTVAATSSFTVQVTDSTPPARTATRTLTLTTIDAGAPTLVVTTAPTNVVGGQPFTLRFRVENGGGSGIPSAAVSLSLASKGCSTAILSGALSAFSDFDGYVQFTNVRIDRGGEGYTIRATSGLASATTGAIHVEGFCATGGNLASRRYATLTKLADGRVLLAGGNSDATQFMDSAEIFDPLTGSFTPTAGHLVVGRWAHQATLLSNGKVLIVGGLSAGGPTAVAELFDPVTGMFSATTGSAGTGRYQFTATPVRAVRKVLVTGGQTETAEVYDETTDTFSPTGSMASWRALHAATQLADGRVLVAGGYTWGVPDNVALDTAEIWDPATGLFTPTGSLITPRSALDAAILPDGRVLIVGGQVTPGGGAELDSAEIFEPRTEAFSATGSMTVARSFLNVVPLPSGKILVLGSYAASPDVFDPATGTFTPTGRTISDHTAGGAVLLSTGRVLVASGWAETTNELFYPTPLTTFLVTNTLDTGTGSLRKAILDANAHPGLDAIHFAIPGAGIQTISPASALPLMSDPVLLDATTQPGYAGTPLIRLDGTGLSGAENGLDMTASHSLVTGLIVTRFPAHGISISNATGTRLIGNYVGTDGTAALGNGIGGVRLTAFSQGFVEGNVVSGNTGIGLALVSSSIGNSVVDNKVGVDPTGSTVLPNTDLGLYLDHADSNILRQNIFSGNDTNGWMVASHNNRLAANRIGTNAAGTAALGSGAGAGLVLWDSDLNVIGGSAPGDANVISGNAHDGIRLYEACNNNRIAGNRIGTDITGTVPLGNGAQGVWIGGNSYENLVGGPTDADANVISGNVEGIAIYAPAHDNTVEGNRVGTDLTGNVALGNSVNGLHASGATNTTLRGNLVSGNAGDGIWINDGATGTVVDGNRVGTNAAGTAALANTGHAVVVTGAATALNAIRGNLLSGNDYQGVEITDNAHHNTVAANKIGTDFSGTYAVPNATHGVGVGGGAHDNTIGGAAPADRNLISGNGNFGAAIADTTGPNTIQNNFIGTNAAGNAAIANGWAGVALGNGNSSTVAGNLVSGNLSNGITIDNATAGAVITNNLVGTDAAGAVAIGNLGDGIGIYNGATNNLVSDNTIAASLYNGIRVNNAPLNTLRRNLVGTNAAFAAGLRNGHQGVSVAASSGTVIGGTNPGDGNVVAYNGQGGIALESGATNTQILGNVVSGNSVDGIRVLASPNSTIAGNLIGTDPTGTAAWPNTSAGIELTGNATTDTTIGGVNPGDGNLVSGNGGGGIALVGAKRTRILGNRVGTNATATAPLGNAFRGIMVYYGADDSTIADNVIAGNTAEGIVLIEVARTTIRHNWIGTNGALAAGFGNQFGISTSSCANTTIGGPNPGDGNVIANNAIGGVFDNTASATQILGNVVSGNTGPGMVLTNCLDATVAANRIGTNPAGTAPWPNGSVGIEVYGPSTTRITIGGKTPGTGNVISGNNGDGVLVDGTTLSPVTFIWGNSIGTDATGTLVIPNTSAGIRLLSSNNQIGDHPPGAGGNVIAFNGTNGIEVGFGNGNDIVHNRIFSNGNLGIFLGSGANHGLNAPVITSAVDDGTWMTVTGTVNVGDPSQDVWLDFFANGACDPSGFGEGQIVVGQRLLHPPDSDPSGVFHFTAIVIGGHVGQAVTATAQTMVGTRAGDTSPFSACVTAVGP